MLILSACGSYSSENSATNAYFISMDATSDFKKMNWLVGSWKGMYQGKPFYEAWRQPNDSVLINYTIEINNSDTLVKPSGTIHLRGKNIFYGTDSVYWKLQTMGPQEIVFKNDSLPYSRTILWQHTTNDHWYTKLTHPNNAVSEYDLEKQPALDAYVTYSLETINPDK